MKHLKLTLLIGLTLSVLGASAFANTFSDRNWHSVLVCDGGAAVIDNQIAIGRGGAGAQAQIVIRDPNILGYLNEAGAITTSQLASEWIGTGSPEMVEAGTMLSFSLKHGDGSVRFDGAGLYVDLGRANWSFRHCVQQ